MRFRLAALMGWLVIASQAYAADALADIDPVVRVKAAAEPPEIDLSEILDDPAQTRQRLGWMAALRVGTAAGMYYLNSQSIKDQCKGELCGLMGLDLIEAIQLSALEGETLAAMTEIFQTTIAESAAAGTAADAEELADTLRGQAGDATIQSEMASLTGKYVSAATDFTVAGLPQDDGDGATVAQAPTHLLEIGLDQIRTDGNFLNAGLAIELIGTARLVDLESGETVEEFTHIEKTGSYQQDEWTVGGAGVMAQELVVAMAHLTEVLAEEVLLVVNSPSGKGKGYLMQPVDPKSGVCLMRCRGTMWGNFGFQAEIGSLTPTITWEPFEDRYAEDPLYPERPTVDAVSYDVRLFEAVPITRLMGDKLYGAGPLLQEHRGITTNELMIDQPLPACTRLVWTVRARFDVGGKRHLSRWSGHYNERKIERMRRDEIEGRGKFNDGMGAIVGRTDLSTQRQESAWYYAFRTPPPEGQKRCKW